MSWQDRICIDPEICHGKACVAGTRVMISVVLDNLAAGESHKSITDGYHIEEADIQAALHYAAALANERILRLPVGVT